MTQQKQTADPIREAVENSANAAEEIHKTVADLPFEVLERTGLFGRTAGELRRIQNDSIGAVYDAVRAVNRRVAELASDLLDESADAVEERPEA